MSNLSAKNPYANSDGSPKAGQEEAFYQFERNKLPENRNELPRSDAEILTDEEKAIGEQMDADPEEENSK